jgi:hypothetical protein
VARPPFNVIASLEWAEGSLESLRVRSLKREIERKGRLKLSFELKSIFKYEFNVSKLHIKIQE